METQKHTEYFLVAFCQNATIISSQNKHIAKKWLLCSSGPPGNLKFYLTHTRMHAHARTPEHTHTHTHTHTGTPTKTQTHRAGFIKHTYVNLENCFLLYKMCYVVRHNKLFMGLLHILNYELLGSHIQLP